MFYFVKQQKPLMEHTRPELGLVHADAAKLFSDESRTTATRIARDSG